MAVAHYLVAFHFPLPVPKATARILQLCRLYFSGEHTYMDNEIKSGLPFEIGLVGAGAISAGAYTSGVVDFMVYALDQWYVAKKEGKEDTPPHEVKLSVFSGASAGAITAALAAGYLSSDQPAISKPSDAVTHKGKNKLFDSWVERIDISRLLENRDLEDQHNPVMSLLDSTVLSEIADNGLTVTPRTKKRDYIAENFNLLLTVTNLRGVPYAFKIASTKPASYDMSLHADYVHFNISDHGTNNLPDRYGMRWSDFSGDSEAIQKIKISALASGAFPVGLAPRVLSLNFPSMPSPDWYSSRTWPIPTPCTATSHECTTAKAIPANFGELNNSYQYKFQCVDGGVMNNEPFELARRILAGDSGRNSRLGLEADKAILLIDPFPSDSSFDPKYEPAPDLLKTLLGLFSALKNQARFKPDELELAAQEDVYSRFMIAPSRDNMPFPIACGSLSGFGGFLKRDFREHDYFLGRRNAQKFFKDHFILPEHNSLFDNWTNAMRNKYAVTEATGNRMLPIIPLCNGAEADFFNPVWPAYNSDDLEKLMSQIDQRVGNVIDRLVSQYFKTNNIFIRIGANFILRRKKEDITDMIKEIIVKDLRKMGLMQ